MDEFEVSDAEIRESNTIENPNLNEGNQVTSEWLQQTFEASIHCATVEPRLLIEECLGGTGGFVGIAEGKDPWGNRAKTYIIPKQSEAFFKNKVAGGVYVNKLLTFCRSLITPIFSANVHYDTNNEGFKAFLARANGNGATYDSVKESIGINAVAQQVSYVIMDKSPDSDKVNLSWKRTVDVYSDDEDCGFGINEDGELDWIGFLISVDADGLMTRYKHIVGAIEIQTKEANSCNQTWKTVEVRYTGVEDMINVFPLFYRDTKAGEFVPTNPEMLGVVKLMVNIYNLDTKIDYVISQQTHGTLVISTAGEIKGVPDGMSNVLVMPQSPDGTNSTAEFISIDADIVKDALLEVHRKKTEELLHLMGDKGVEAVNTSNNESGYAKEFSFVGKNAELLHGVDVFKKLDKWVEVFWGRLQGDTTQFEVKTTYPSDFYPTSKSTIEQLEIVWEVAKPTNQILLQQATLKAMASIVGVDLPYEQMQAIYKEIETLKITDPLTGMPQLD